MAVRRARCSPEGTATAGSARCAIRGGTQKLKRRGGRFRPYKSTVEAGICGGFGGLTPQVRARDGELLMDRPLPFLAFTRQKPCFLAGHPCSAERREAEASAVGKQECVGSRRAWSQLSLAIDVGASRVGGHAERAEGHPRSESGVLRRRSRRKIDASGGGAPERAERQRKACGVKRESERHGCRERGHLRA